MMGTEIEMIEIKGIVDASENPIHLIEFNVKFCEWLESNGWAFGGSMDEYKESEQ